MQAPSETHASRASKMPARFKKILHLSLIASIQLERASDCVAEDWASLRIGTAFSVLLQFQSQLGNHGHGRLGLGSFRIDAAGGRGFCWPA